MPGGSAAMCDAIGTVLLALALVCAIGWMCVAAWALDRTRR